VNGGGVNGGGVNFDDFAPPRRVEGGLRARTARGAIGQSWWSRRFLAVLESFALGTRLTRGRAYARAGQVLSIDISRGKVTASVQGSREQPYRVSIGLPAFPELGWARIEIVLAEQALYSAQLLAGELPPELERVFADAGLPLFPAAVGDLDMRCSCPDGAVPCKHLAATFYLLAEAFDADPFQILQWRGRSREALLDRLRALRAVDAPDGSADEGPHGGPVDGPGGGPAGGPVGLAGPVTAGPVTSGPTGISPAAEGPVVGAAHALAELVDQPLEACIDRFWLPSQPLPPRPPTLDAAADLLLRQLPAPGVAIGGPGLVERLRTAYQRFAQPEAVE